MSDYQNATQSSRVDEIRKAILSLKFEEIQDLLYDLPPRPPARAVTITVERDPQIPGGRILQVKQDADRITTTEQLVWTCPDGRVEIRFSPAATPFATDMYEVARGGKAYSGMPVIRKQRSYKYTILVTTQNGFFLTKEVVVNVVPASGSTRVRKTKGNK